MTKLGHLFSKEMNSFENKEIYMNKNPEDILSINGALWNKLYKTELLKNVKQFDVPPIIFEDMMLFNLIVNKANKITFINDCLYYYMVKEVSAISSIDKKQQELSEKTMIDLRKIYEENNLKLVPVIDSLAFLHFGISLMFRLSYDKNINMKIELRNNKRYLNENFPTWRKTKYLSLWYCITHKGNNLKVAIMKKIYIFHMLGIFLKVYRFMIDKLKIDIKW